MVAHSLKRIQRHNSSIGNKREFFILFGILLFGLFLRVLYLNEIVDNPDFSSPILDASFHHYWAKGLATGNWFISGTDPLIRSIPYIKFPGYPYFLAFIYWLFGPDFLISRIVQMGLGLASCTLAFLFGKRWFGSTVGLIFSAFMSLYWIFIYFEGELYGTVLLVFLALLLVYTLSTWINKISFLRCAVGGFILGLFALVRANILLFIPIAVMWLAWIRYKKKWSNFPLSAVGFILGIVLAISPVTIRNYVVAKEFVLISTTGGLNFFIGNSGFPDSIQGNFIPRLKEIAGIDSWSLFDYPIIVRGLEKKLGKRLTFSEASAYWTSKAIRYIKTHPWKSLIHTLKKAVLFWHPMEIANPTQIHYDRFHSRVLRNIPGNFSAVFALSLVGIILLFLDFKKRPGSRNQIELPLWRTNEKTSPKNKFLQGNIKKQSPLFGGFGNGETSFTPQQTQYEVTVLILLFIVTYFVSFLPFFVSARYRVPIIPFLLLFGSYGLYRIAKFISSRNFQSAAGWLCALIIMYLLLNTNFVSYKPDHALWYFHRGQSFLQNGKTDSAIKEYLEAIRTKPNFSEVHNYMGVALFKQGKHNEAIAYYQRALLIKPDYNEALNNLGVTLAIQGNYDEAIKYYLKALLINSNFAEAHYNFGFALARQEKIEEAVKHYSKALLIKPDYADAHFKLGFILTKQGKMKEAYTHYSKALSIKPDDARIHYNLGIILAKQGKLEKAITYFSEALRIKPDFAEARHNLEIANTLQKQK